MGGYWTGTMSERADCPYLMYFLSTAQDGKLLNLRDDDYRDDYWQVRPVWDPNFNN